MSDVNNPLFDNQREFLERQKEEYKNALMGDVSQIKNQGQEIGKKVAIAGGVLLAGLLVRRMFSGGKKKAPKVAKSKKGKDAVPGTMPVSHPVPDYDPIKHRTVTDFTAGQPSAFAGDTQSPKNAMYKKKAKPGLVKTMMNSPFARQMMQQGVTLLVAYIAKKAADSMQTQSENNDIAAKAVPATEADPVVKSVSDQHAI